MLGRLKQLISSSGAKGPVPSGLCLWRDLDGLDQLAIKLAHQAGEVSDWQAWKEAAQLKQPQP